ncbi:MAG: hypothetical protein ABF649_08805 [Bacillus sp. (in: firmicutes)]
MNNLGFNLDWDDVNRNENVPFMNLDLYINERYECLVGHGNGVNGHQCYKFHITPPLPDDLTGLTFIFKEFSNHLKEVETGLNITFDF